MSRILDNKALYAKDSLGIYQAILAIGAQIQSAWEQTSELKGGVASRVVVIGMGGSALGARVIRGMFAKSLRAPIEIVNDSWVPAYLKSEDLVIVVSYSGNTEETLRAAKEIPEGVGVVAVTEGGELLKLAEEKNWVVCKFEKRSNPGNMPRMALASNVIIIGGILAKYGVIDLELKEIEEAKDEVKKAIALLNKEVDSTRNQAKSLAETLMNRQVLFWSAEHLNGVAYAIRNQINENAKTSGYVFELPELDHHLIEGLSYPESVKEHSEIVVWKSNLYSEFIKKRVEAVVGMAKEQGWRVSEVEMETGNEWRQLWEAIVFGEMVAFYLAIAMGIDPGPIKWVDRLKKIVS